jgi:hypothetical protein
MKKTYNTPPSNASLKIQVGSEREESLWSLNSIAIPQKYVTILSAQQASFLASNPPKLNIPPGKYLFLSGVIENNSSTTDLAFSVGDSDINISDGSCTISKTNSGGTPIIAGGFQVLEPYYAVPVAAPSGQPYSLLVDEDNPEPLDGPIKITLLVYPL